jgi:sugar/nucleoside kinase (ribokinase family)
VRHLIGESGISLKSPPLDPDAGPLRIRVYRRRDEVWRLSRCDNEGRWNRRQLRQALAADLSVLANSAEIVLADFGRLGQLDADHRFPPLCGLTTKDTSWLSLPVEICCVSTDDLRLCAETAESLRQLAQGLAKDARAEEFVLTGSEHGAVGVSSFGTTYVQIVPTQNALTAGAGDWLLGALVKARLDGSTAAAALQGAAREATATCLDDVVGGDTPELATEVPAAHVSRALGLPLDM